MAHPNEGERSEGVGGTVGRLALFTAAAYQRATGLHWGSTGGGAGWVGLGQGLRQEQGLGSGRPSVPDHEAEHPDCPVPRPSGLSTSARPHRSAGDRETPPSCVCVRARARSGGPPVQIAVGPCSLSVPVHGQGPGQDGSQGQAAPGPHAGGTCVLSPPLRPGRIHMHMHTCGWRVCLDGGGGGWGVHRGRGGTVTARRHLRCASDIL